MNNFLFENKTYSIIGVCMEVNRILGHGFSEIVYKDAMTLEAHSKGFPVEREKEFKIEYKQVTLKHSYLQILYF